MTLLTPEQGIELFEIYGKDLIIPETITAIGADAFRNLGIQTVKIPNGVKSIGDYSFYNTDLKAVVIPETVDKIGENAFLPDVVIIGSELDKSSAVQIFSKLGSSFFIPPGVTRIGKDAFNNGGLNELTSISIPDCVQTIDEGAFHHTAIERIQIPNSIIEIGKNAFSYTNITSIKIPAAVRKIESGVFKNTLLESIEIPETITEIGEYAFANTYISKVDIPDSVTAIGDYAFDKDQYNDEHTYPKIKSLKIGKNVETIGDGAFRYNRLSTLQIPKSVSRIGDYAFYSSSGQRYTLTIPDKVTTIGDYAFSRNAFNGLNIGNGVKTIGDGAFAKSSFINENDENITIIIPDNVTTIGNYAFENNLPLQIKTGAVTHVTHSNYKGVVIGNGVTIIGDYAFAYPNLVEGTAGLTSVTLGNSVQWIGKAAFKYSDLTEINIPDSVSQIDSEAFFYSELESLELGKCVNKIGDKAFYENNLKSVDLSNDLTTIGEEAFYGNPLENISIPSSVKKIGRGAFRQTSIKSVIIPEGTIFEDAFDAGVEISIKKFPTDIKLTSNIIPENIEENATAALLSTLHPDSGETFIYKLVEGCGDASNNNFSIIGNQLKTNKKFDHEFKSSHSIRLQTMDSDGLTFEKSVTISVGDINESPDDISISTLKIDENIAEGSTIATLSSEDPDSEDTHIYSLVSDNKNTDNQRFFIYENQLKINTAPDYETKSSYSIRLKTEDTGGLSFEKSFVLTVNDLDEFPGSTDSGGGGSSSSGGVGSGSSSGGGGGGGSSSGGGGGGGGSSSGGGGGGGGGGSSSTTSESVTTPEANPAPEEIPVDDPTTTTPQAETSETQKQVVDGTIQSIDMEAIKPIKVSTFALTKSIQVGREEVEILIVGTKKKDKITGSSEGEVLAGGEGKDVLSGGDGADGFLFQNPEGFGKKEADKITDFDADEGDSVLVDKEVFDLGRKVKFKSVTGKKAAKKASKSNKEFVYDGNKGLLYFNENGKAKGWGDDGGLFTKLIGAPALGASDFTIV